MENKKIIALVAGLGLLVGGAVTVGMQAFAQQNSTPTPAATVQAPSQTQPAQVKSENENDPATSSESETNEPADTNHSHRPLGGDGVVSSINGTTIVMGEESDEGSAPYTVDASTATITNNGVAASLSDIKVGDKIFVEGGVTGTNVKATTVSLGHPENKGNDANEAPGTETKDDGGTSAAE